MNHFPVVGGIMQVRELIKPVPPDGLNGLDAGNWVRHFWEREKAENHYFETQDVPKINLMITSKENLNDEKSASFIKELQPDIVVIFGIGMIREPLLSVLPHETLNLHLGLSPRYRGAATLFYPFYFLEPNWAGATFHYITDSPDAGSIIHQTRPELYLNDGIHDVACHTVMKATQDAIRLLSIHKKEGGWHVFDQKPEAGKNFLESDFKPQYLRMIYNEYDNDIVKEYLNGHIVSKETILKRQFP